MIRPSARALRRGSLTATTVLGLLVALAAFAYACTITMNGDHLANVRPEVIDQSVSNPEITLDGWCVLATTSNTCKSDATNGLTVSTPTTTISSPALYWAVCQAEDATATVYDQVDPPGSPTKPECPLQGFGHDHDPAGVPCHTALSTEQAISGSTGELTRVNGPSGAIIVNGVTVTDGWVFQARGTLPTGIDRGRVAICLSPTAASSISNDYWQWDLLTIL